MAEGGRNVRGLEGGRDIKGARLKEDLQSAVPGSRKKKSSRNLGRLGKKKNLPGQKQGQSPGTPHVDKGEPIHQNQELDVKRTFGN